MRGIDEDDMPSSLDLSYGSDGCNVVTMQNGQNTAILTALKMNTDGSKTLRFDFVDKSCTYEKTAQENDDDLTEEIFQEAYSTFLEENGSDDLGPTFFSYWPYLPWKIEEEARLKVFNTCLEESGFFGETELNVNW